MVARIWGLLKWKYSDRRDLMWKQLFIDRWDFIFGFRRSQRSLKSSAIYKPDLKKKALKGVHVAFASHLRRGSFGPQDCGAS